jgi:hypothetical protein
VQALATLTDPKQLAKPINVVRAGLDGRDETPCRCHVHRQRDHRSARQRQRREITARAGSVGGQIEAEPRI